MATTTTTRSFLHHLKATSNTKWISTVSSIWIQLTSGSLYTFSIYSPFLKSTQHYSQSALDTVSVSKDFGANCGILAGLLYSHVASRGHRTCGPWIVLLAGALQSFAGYFLMWCSVTGVIPRPPLPVMCVFMLVAAHVQSFFNTADVVTAVRNFPGYSGTAVGIMKGFLGLSGAFLIQIYQATMNSKPSAFLLMLALLPSVNAILLMWLVRVHDGPELDEKKRLDAFSIISLIVAAYLMVVIVLENIIKVQVLLRLLAFAILVILLASPLCVATKAQEHDSRAEAQVSSRDETPLIYDQEHNHPNFHEEYAGQGTKSADYHPLPGNSDQEKNSNEKKGSESEVDLDLFQAMRTLDFWILFSAMACGMGSGLATINNIGQIGGSLGYSSYEIDSMVSLWSIWNFLGRFGAGYVSDLFLRTREFARPLFMAITLAALSIGHALIASGLPGALYAGPVVVGICYGSQWSLMPTITSEIFGVGHMGTIFNAVTMAAPVGSSIFSVVVIGYIYDAGAGGKGKPCIGRHCFMLSFFIMAAAALLGSLSALVLFYRTRHFYTRVVLRKLRHALRR